MAPGIGTVQVAGGQGRWNLQWDHTKLQAAMGDATWNGDNTGSMWQWAMEFEIKTAQVGVGHGRRNLEWRQLSLQAAMGAGT